MVIYKFTSKKTLVVLPLLLGSYSSLTFAETGESTFVKDTKTGCKIYDLEESNHSASWSGACVDGKISGNGTLTIVSKKPNATCENRGEMKEGLRTGRSVTQCSDGVRIEGEYKPVAGVVNGIGTVSFPNGSKYFGEMKGPTLHGLGRFTAASGESAIGAFINNKFSPDKKIAAENFIQKYKNSVDPEIISIIVDTISDQTDILYSKKQYSEAIEAANKIIRISRKNKVLIASRNFAKNYVIKCASIYNQEGEESAALANCARAFFNHLKYKDNPTEFHSQYDEILDKYVIRILLTNIALKPIKSPLIIAQTLKNYTDPEEQAQAAIIAIEMINSFLQPLSIDERINSLNNLWSGRAAIKQSTNFDLVMAALDEIVNQLSTSNASKTPEIQAQIASAIYSQCKILSREPTKTGQGFACYENSSKRLGLTP